MKRHKWTVIASDPYGQETCEVCGATRINWWTQPHPHPAKLKGRRVPYCEGKK